MTTTDKTAAARRQVLAFIALTDAPAPSDISFRSTDDRPAVLRMEVDSTAAAETWVTAFGGDWWGGDNIVTLDATDERPASRIAVHYTSDTWRGWHIEVRGTDRLRVDGLDAGTRDQLAEAAAEGGAR